MPRLLCFVLAFRAIFSSNADSTHPQPLKFDLSPSSPDQILQRYFSNEQLGQYLQNYAKRCSNISRLFSIGKSASGRWNLWALEISNNPGTDEPKPYVKLVANMHGNEPSGRQLLLQLAEELCTRYSSDPEVASLVDGFHVMILPTMNPDGFERRMRPNIQGKDLNRDFPDPIQAAMGRGWSDNLAPTGREAPETRAVMDWARSHHFVAGVSMHEGAVVANYPWDGSLDRRTHYSASPDDAAFRHLATVYAQRNKDMAASKEFPGGVTNGAAWYPLYGGMQDWNYLAADCMEITLELSQRKFPDKSLLPGLWEANRDALVALLTAAAYGGAWGTVVGTAGGAEPTPLAAEIRVAGISKAIRASRFGDFYRPLAPGNYTVTASAAGYMAQSKEVAIPRDGSGARLEFVLPSAGDRDLQGRAGGCGTAVPSTEAGEGGVPGPSCRGGESASA
uniref:Carboxypeptidase D n=1 Tax=Tetraselmis sp. GSL018 TaxID=582737 RepID=A0A061S7Q8_9CHLO